MWPLHQLAQILAIWALGGTAGECLSHLPTIFCVNGTFRPNNWTSTWIVSCPSEGLEMANIRAHLDFRLFPGTSGTPFAGDAWADHSSPPCKAFEETHGKPTSSQPERDRRRIHKGFGPALRSFSQAIHHGCPASNPIRQHLYRIRL
jgi:hypothetical protein